jgi:spore coat polysaccharide biosynthesis protein SpsF
MSSPQIVVVVQARMSSSRLPGKVLLPLLNRPLLARQIERIQQSRHAFTTVVATSTDPADDPIEALCVAQNWPCYRGSLTDVLDRHAQVAEQWNADVIVKIPSDCPLIDPRAIDRVFDVWLQQPDLYDFVSNLHPPTWPDGNDVEMMSRAALRRANAEATRPLEREHTTPYFWENPDRFRIANVAWETDLDYSMSHRFTIDYPADYKFISRVYGELYTQRPNFSCADILGLLDRQPDIYNINAQYAGVNWYRHHLDELQTVSADQTRQL